MSNPTKRTHTDPVTDAPEFHPVGTSVGATGGGVTGAAVGTAVAGPIGGVIGTAIGAVIGGLAGKEVAEAYDPTGEDNYWREGYKTRNYVKTGEPYELYRPAYAYGYETRRRRLDSRFDEVENDLEQGWESLKDNTELTWERAKHAVQDGWERVEDRFEGMFKDEDDYWRENYANRPYVTAGQPYENYEPAYRYGYRTRMERLEDRWEAAENDLESGWENFKGASKMHWNDAKEAARDGWHHIERSLPGDFDNDGR